MDSEPVATATPTETQTDAAPPAELSIAEHEAQFGQQAQKEESAPPVEPPRHRAQSQRARPSDVDEIAAVTKRLREAEDAIPIERKQGESERVYQLRRRAEIAELAKTYRTQPPPIEKPAPVVAPPTRAAAPPPPPTGKPTWATFEAKIGETYQTWAEAQDAFADARDEWRETDRQRQQAERETQATRQAAIDRDQKAIVAHQARMADAVKDPSYQALIAPVMNRPMPSALLKAIVTSDKSPELVKALALDPDLLDDVFLASHGKSEDDDELVASLQRRLSKRVQAVSTGSVAPPPLRTAPRPPNPVRTGPLKTTDEPPGDDASIAEHEKYYGKRRR